MANPEPPFSARHRGQNVKVDNSFPETARTALVHVLYDLVDRRYVAGWPALAQELRRISRQPPVSYGSSGGAEKQAKADAETALASLKWEKAYDFCERLYSHLAQEVGHWEDHEVYEVDTAAQPPPQAGAASGDIYSKECLRAGHHYEVTPVEHSALASEVYNSADPVGMHLEITNACNMTCTHCYVASGKPLPNEMSMELIYKTVDMLPPFSGKQIAISGGEPIVRKGCMDLVEYCALTCGHNVDLYSNGRKFPRKFAERIKQVNGRQLGQVRIQVSLEGVTAETNDQVRGQGSFADAIVTLEMFKEIGLSRNTIIFVCLTKANIQEAKGLITLAERLDVGMLVFSQWQRQGNAQDTPWADIAPTLDEWVTLGDHLLSYKNPRLRVMGNFYGDVRNNQLGRFEIQSPLFPKHVYFYNAFPRVTPQGDIFADQLWVDPTWILGNVANGNDLDSSFQSAKFHQQLNDMRARAEIVEECHTCQWRKLCEGGSPGHTYAEYGHMNAKDLFCESRMYWFERYLEFHTKRLLGPDARVAKSEVVSSGTSPVRPRKTIRLRPALAT